MIGIYKITSPTGRIYVGQSKDIYYRWNQYKYNYENHNNRFIEHSIKKYGYDQHVFEIIEECNQEYLNEREIYWIETLKTNYKKYPENNGLNFSDGGDNPPVNYGRILSDKELLNISQKNKKNHANKRIKNIKQYNKSGILIKIWENVEEFHNKQKYNYSFVLKACKGTSANYKNYIWRFEKDEFSKFPIRRYKPRSKRVKSKIVKERIYKKPSQETRYKMSISQKLTWTDERRQYHSKLFKGRSNYWKKVKEQEDHVEERMKKIRKPINQYDLKGNLIKEWPSAKDAETVGKFNADLISLVARGLKENYKNYIWKFKNGYIKENP